MTKYPTQWQRKTMWAALTAIFVVVLITIGCSVVWILANVVGFIQPILIPVAIAVILAYLLDPVVTKMCESGLGRTKAVPADQTDPEIKAWLQAFQLGGKRLVA